MEAYRDQRITLVFKNNEEVEELPILQSVFAKMDKQTREAGLHRTFTPNEIDLIRGAYDFIRPIKIINQE